MDTISIAGTKPFSAFATRLRGIADAAAAPGPRRVAKTCAEDLRGQCAAWILPVRRLPVADIEVIRRPARRLVARNAAIGLAAVVVLSSCASAAVRPAAVSPRPMTTPPCAENDLRIRGPESPVETMPGSVTVIVFRNAGGTACSLEGWPKVALLGPRPEPATIPIRYGTATGAWSIALTRVLLPPGASAAASMLIATPTSASGCGSPTWAVTPPRGLRSVVVHQPPGGPRVCVGDSIVVSPVYPGQAPRVSYVPSGATPAAGDIHASAS